VVDDINAPAELNNYKSWNECGAKVNIAPFDPIGIIPVPSPAIAPNVNSTVYSKIDVFNG